jgi:hypothetical protein
MCLHREEDPGKPKGGAIVATTDGCQKEGELRCAIGSEVGRQRCVAGQWQDAPSCPESSVCQRSGAEVGTCAEVEDRCPELEEGVYCDGALMHTCDAGEEASSQMCGSPELCEAGRMEGSCPKCLGGEYRCRGTRLERCGKDGTWELESVCDADASCDASMGVCVSEAAESSDGPVAGTGADGDKAPPGNMMCSGPESQACGNCGMQTRTCDTSTGQWSDWLECSGEGECKSGETGTCGTGGTKTCGSGCRWETACTGQECSGPLTQRCGRCGSGMQTRTCDSNTGQPSAWMVCEGEDGCTPSTSQACAGANQVQRCTASCTWGPCTCTGGLTLCDGSCIDVRSDPNHCGGCTPCSGTRPLCTQSRCVQCRTNSDCTFEPIRPFCSTAIGTCVNCLSDSDCTNNVGPNTRCRNNACENSAPP